MYYIRDLKILGTDVNFLSVTYDCLESEFNKYNILVSLYDTDNKRVISNASFDEIRKAFGVVRSKDYIYFCRVSDGLWRLLDYIDPPKQVFDNDVFRKDSDFLKDIGAEEKNTVVGNYTLNIKEYKTGNRQIIVIILGKILSALDANNIFWIDTLGYRYSPPDSYKTIWLRNDDCFTLFDVYAQLANSNVNFNENSEVYFFGGSFRSEGYKLSINADLVRFLTKIRCLRRGK